MVTEVWCWNVKSDFPALIWWNFDVSNNGG